MADVTETVGNTVKTGANAAKGVPPYVWIIAVGGGLLVAFYFNKNKNTTPDGTNTQAPSALVYTGSGQTPNTSADTDSSAAGGKFQTNEAWAQAAKNWLIAQGVDAKEASDAVDLYINAQALNNKQNAMIANVVRGIGSPPQSLPPVTGTPPPSTPGGNTTPTPTPNSNPSVWGTTPRQNPKAIGGTVYTTQFENENISNMVKYAYGLADWDYSSIVFAGNELINANHDVITDVTHIPKGTKLYFPVLSSQDFPGFGAYVPQFGYTAPAGTAGSTGEWQIDVGQVPQSANIARDQAHRVS